MAAIDVRPVASPADLTAFIRLPNAIYADDPHYVAPLEFELRARLDAAKNPGLAGSRHQLFIAWADGAPAGRVAAIANKGHLDLYKDETGHFGFFESIDDPAVGEALLKTAAAWLKQQGMTSIAGPFSFSVNEECGLLISGFDRPPYLMMPHGRPYYAGQLEALGFEKAQDMHALIYTPRIDFMPERRKKFVDKTMSSKRISIRNLEPGQLDRDIRIAIDIYNDAWSDNWGFIPFTEAHAKHMASELRPIITPDNFVICSIDDEPMAFGLVLPNINEAIAGYGGKLLPFNWADFLWKLKVSGIKSSRMPLMGVRKRIQGKPVGAGFAYKIIEMVNNANVARGVTEAELSWILESNQSMITMLEDIGGRIYKTYRIYKKAL